MLLKKDVFVDFKPQNFRAFTQYRMDAMCVKSETLDLNFEHQRTGSFKIYQRKQLDTFKESVAQIEQKLDAGGTATKEKILPVMGDVKNLILSLKKVLIAFFRFSD